MRSDTLCLKITETMTRPDAEWRRSTSQCVCLSVLISGWPQQPYVVSVPVCLSQNGRGLLTGVYRKLGNLPVDTTY